MSPRSLTVTLALLAGLAAAERVALRDGRTLDARVVEVKDHAVVLEVRENGSVARADWPRERIEKHAWYTIASRAARTGRQHLELARFAAQENLLAQARREADLARARDPSLRDEAAQVLEEVERRMPAALLAWARELAASGNRRGARREASRVLALDPEAEAAAGARELVERLDAEQRQRRMDEELARRLEPVLRLRDRAVELDRGGLAASRELRKSRDAFEAAVRAGREALARIEGLRRRHAADGATLGALAGLEGEVRAQLVESQLNLASVYVNRQSYPQALEAVGVALALDPTSQAARAERARIELANSNGYYGRGVSARR